jgi:hypothetical protein
MAILQLLAQLLGQACAFPSLQDLPQSGSPLAAAAGLSSARRCLLALAAVDRTCASHELVEVEVQLRQKAAEGADSHGTMLSSLLFEPPLVKLHN